MITNYYLGMPCYLGKEVVGKIVAASESGSMGIVNGIEMPSIVIFSTPHGSAIETGIFHLNDIDEEGMKKLEEYEKDAQAKGDDYFSE